jgi:hypothetical protein
MIIRALVKVATFIAFTPVPEYVHMIGRIASVGALAEACNTNVSEKEIEAPNPFYFPGSDAPETTTIFKKDDTAADVWFKLLPTDDFSIRDAIKTFKGLDEDQKEIFILSAIAAACEVFYVINSFIRLGTLTKQRDVARKKMHSAEFMNQYAIARLREEADRESSVIDFYERNHAMIDWSVEDERANYNNVTGSVKFLRGLAEELER